MPTNCCSVPFNIHGLPIDMRDVTWNCIPPPTGWTLTSREAGWIGIIVWGFCTLEVNFCAPFHNKAAVVPHASLARSMFDPGTYTQFDQQPLWPVDPHDNSAILVLQLPWAMQPVKGILAWGLYGKGCRTWLGGNRVGGQRTSTSKGGGRINIWWGRKHRAATHNNMMSRGSV